MCEVSAASGARDGSDVEAGPPTPAPLRHLLHVHDQGSSCDLHKAYLSLEDGLVLHVDVPEGQRAECEEADDRIGELLRVVLVEARVDHARRGSDKQRKTAEETLHNNVPHCHDVRIQIVGLRDLKPGGPTCEQTVRHEQLLDQHDDGGQIH
eukprot:CAMPEP_0204229240 /NCGR_PEP_ID=MMETSP0361-20130328/87064_1 /ASSEMBLY_ACC=CAM_ASM_000343 /TAXON_ID=268821 /ORGANISM="Scrippsiella Hangoei, Strain SHTV-5" /LENGTH=151 /DNA_ID=CAMNT_0051197631 /DNA_START=9 /DNA_END=464 /DNA_ORIENTATION=-